MKIQRQSDPDDLDSDRIVVWEVNYLPPGDPLEWRATSLGEYHFESESYPFLRGYISVKDPPMSFAERLTVDIASAAPNSQVGLPLVKQKPTATLTYGDLKGMKQEESDKGTFTTGLDHSEDATREATFDDVPYEPLRGEPELVGNSISAEVPIVETTDRLFKHFEAMNSGREQSFRPAATWSQRSKAMPTDRPLMNFYEVDMDSHQVISNTQPEWMEYKSRGTRAEGQPTSSSQARPVPKVTCSCGKTFSSSLNQMRCEALHPSEQLEGDRKKAKSGGMKKRDADASALKSRLLQLKEFWKQMMLIDQRAKILALDTLHLATTSSLLVVSPQLPASTQTPN